MRYFLIYLIIVNVISAVVCAADKYASKRDMQRVPEKTLFLLSFLGGSAGMLITMKLIRHKTKHKRFMLGIPLIILLQLSACFLYLYLTR